MAATALISATPARAIEAARRETASLRVLAMSDLHSAYDRTGQLLAALEAEVATGTTPHVIAVNGDVFEHGNVVAVRSGGAIDWAFLAELPKLAPTVVNLGNHDNDITPDLAEVVARLRDLGATVVTNIVDARTGRSFAPAVADLALGRRRLRIVGVATDALNTYPAASRPRLDIPPPGAWARANLTQALAGADLMMVMSHAGVAGDRDILPLLPDGAHMVGGHNHLLFQHRQGRSLYVHTGSWSSAYTVLTFGGAGDAVSIPVSAGARPSAHVADRIAATLHDTLTADETTVLGVSPRALSLGDTGRAVAAALARATGAQAGFIGHTTLGASLANGPVSRFDFDAVVRFDGKLMVAEVTPDRLAQFMRRANQDRPMPLDQRNGDFLYAQTFEQEHAAPVRIVTTDWCATNQVEYFGVSDLVFTEAPDLKLKSVAGKALLASR
ncbi:metallophosphoesterase [Brevundimonas sp.]|jgi:5'-nucleotidase/UDP-sugar diphosphatase|uniref:metallophosphoesterase n=1 Tax=Brevundimonas sp. TaxID=1871086 RepID=UPI0037BF91F3